MRIIFGTLLRLALFWMTFFTVNRAIFLIYYVHLIKAESIPFGEISSVFIHAIQIDLATISYILLIPLIVLTASCVFGKYFWIRVLRIFMIILIFVYALITSAELGLYGEWKTKLSYKALEYLKQPAEIFNSASLSEFLTLVLIWTILTIVGIYSYIRWIEPAKQLHSKASFKPALSILIVIPVLFFGARGGLSAIPLSISSAYFSNFNILNITAVNPLYNIGVNILNAAELSKDNIFKSMPDDQALAIVKRLHEVEMDTTISIFKIEKPNIVVVLLESWSADLIESLGGEAGITPNFRELEQEGLLFTNFYANANRSQQAIGALYGGLPGIPITTITNHPEKYASLPSLSMDLKSKGYFTSFYFGGQLNYGNILSYLIYNNIDRIVEGKNLPSELERGKLGVHDSFLLPFFAQQLDQQPQPFFSTVFTLSSHSPYDFPMEHQLQWPILEKDFVNSAYYTDKALGEFYELVRQKSWFKNTIFVIMADHSHNTYRNHPIETFDYHKIPLLLCGPALKDSLHGKIFDQICGNTDIPATLLKQLDLKTEQYFWSKNLFNPYYKPFAYFELNEGLGWKKPDGYFVWDKFGDRFFQKQLPVGEKDSLLIEGKAYLQILFEEFLSY